MLEEPTSLRIEDPGVRALFTVSDPDNDAAGKTYRDYLNPQSKRVVHGCIEASLATAQPEQSFQFERLGYFVVERYDSKPGALVFNRSVTLRDSWAKAKG